MNSSQSKGCSSLDHGNNPAHIRQRMYDNDSGAYSKFVGNPENTGPHGPPAQALLFLHVPEGAGQNWEKCSSLPLSTSTHTQNSCHESVRQTQPKKHSFSPTMTDISDNIQTLYLSPPRGVQPNPQRFSVINHFKKQNLFFLV